MYLVAACNAQVQYVASFPGHSHRRFFIFIFIFIFLQKLAMGMAWEKATNLLETLSQVKCPN